MSARHHHRVSTRRRVYTFEVKAAPNGRHAGYFTNRPAAIDAARKIGTAMVYTLAEPIYQDRDEPANAS